MATPHLHSPTPPSQQLLKQWLQRHLDLLQQERNQEQAQSKLLTNTPPKLLEQNGLALLGLGVTGVSIGLGANLLVELQRPSAYHTSTLFPAHSFRPGNLAEIQDHSISTIAQASSSSSKPSASSKSNAKASAQPVQGVVYKVSDSRIVLAFSARRKKPSKTSSSSFSSSSTPAASTAEGGEAKSDKRNVRSGDATKVSGDELDIPQRVRLVKAANETTFDRMERTLAKLAKSLGVSVQMSGGNAGDSSDDDDSDDAAATAAAGDASTVSAPRSASGATVLVRTLMGLQKPTFTSPLVDLPLPPFNDRLNASQLDAIRFALSAQQVALIHGPPGTGKTTAIVELIMQLVTGNIGLPSSGSDSGGGGGSARGVHILVCGASNLAVDNLLERIVGKAEHREALKKRGAGVTRLGHPARVLSSLHAFTLDAQSSASSESQLVSDVASELSSALSALRPPSASEVAGNKSVRSAQKSFRLKGSERRQRWEEVRLLRREYRQRERGVTRAILDRAQIVVATCHGAGGKQLAGREFDVVIIDEACQALEAVCWIPILKCREGGKVILAGDHLQLPPTVKSGKKKGQEARGKKEGSKGKSKEEKKEKNDEKRGDKIEFVAPAGTEDGNSPAAADDDDKDDDEASPTFVETTSGPPTSKTTSLRPPRSLETTLFSRLLGLYGSGLKTLLSVQYRMNSSIMAFPNEALYESRLEAHKSCHSISISDLDNYVVPEGGRGGGGEEEEEGGEEEVETAPVVFYDTAGYEMYETSSQPDDSTSGGGGKKASGTMREPSRSNENEATLITRHISLLTRRGITAEQLTVLSPYSAQVSLISSSLRDSVFASPTCSTGVRGEKIEVGTIDAMQGREKDVVLLSLVRSNETGQVGFLEDKRRLNVAMTRAKRQLVVVGDSETVGAQQGYLARWMNWLDVNALVESVVTLELK